MAQLKLDPSWAREVPFSLVLFLGAGYTGCLPLASSEMFLSPCGRLPVFLLGTGLQAVPSSSTYCTA